ncbi:hypothetical protein [Actinomycetospora atypica]|uniref:Glycosyltransferase RgtA/B/C/D-like domain-containing protein n=1 Tax=Actinomycetospora atypica TaxID=1290095 RepID=A0ABV9YFF6_9PSEU
MGGVIAPARMRSWTPGALFGLVGGGLGLVQLLVVTLTPGVWRPLAFSSDDLHYYVLPALNLAQGAGSTFDGLQPTNGYQPLWFLLLAAAFRVVGVDRAGAFVVVMALLALLWGLAVWLLWRLRAFLTTTGAAAGLAVLLLHGRWWSGCENALVGVLLLVLVDQVLRRGVLARVPTVRDAGLVGALLALLVLGRLDTAVLVGLLGAWGLWRWRSVPLVAAVVGPAVATLGVYAAVNQLLFGTALPVSGLAKQLGPFGDNLPALGQFLLYGTLGPLPLFFGATVLVVGAWALVLLDRSPLRLVIAGLLVAQVVQVSWYAVTTSGWELQSWYFSCGVMALVLSVGVVVARWSAAWVAPAVGVVVVGLLLVSGAHAVGDVLVRDPSASPVTRDIDAGLWADRTLPPGSVLAMGDWAGTLGVTSRVPVVQLEGLMGSPAYLAALRDGTVPAYLSGLGVTHYARLFHPGEPFSCRVSEPWFGVSPKVPLDLCGRPVVYRGDVQGVVELVIWDVRGAL